MIAISYKQIKLSCLQQNLMQARALSSTVRWTCLSNKYILVGSDYTAQFSYNINMT